MFHVVVRTLVGRCAVSPSPDLLLLEASCLASDFKLFPSIGPGPAARPLSCPDEVWRCFEMKATTWADQNITAWLAHLEKWVEFDLSLRNRAAVRFECLRHFSFCAICYFMFTLHWCNVLNPSITAIYQILYDRTHGVWLSCHVKCFIAIGRVWKHLELVWSYTFPKVSRQTNREPGTLNVSTS